MRVWILLLGALLALASQLPAALGRKKGEKSGGCPPDDGPCLLSVPDQCLEDRQCPSTMKCCHRACFRQCIPRVSVKLGSCPKDLLQCLSPMNHLCHKDSDCSGQKRCCHGACGRDCRDPARD
ncbi:PREDICTED: WAP four-disulfide core domain protein 5 [Galeopterus variegatus]|uniref:WAP four-disulfide core domain protein 5 n=1 Tax=Galeopterus variegatus TaxID=482537 RepID=A0ABM0Q046_GALVR|nr:PREDICTED: WAP four-disulfide core domain protein 5 [Galeopterus variegatus]XP_008562109.1 PREDICTED: WAP four-disulfide core domain protein 5 [Galeopterus variegatus]